MAMEVKLQLQCTLLGGRAAEPGDRADPAALWVVLLSLPNARTAHPDVPCISFTGGTATGKLVAAAAAPMFKKLR